MSTGGGSSQAPVTVDLQRIGGAVRELGRSVVLGDRAGYRDPVAGLEVVGVGPARIVVRVDAVGRGRVAIAGEVLEEEPGGRDAGDAAGDAGAVALAGRGVARSLQFGDRGAGGRFLGSWRLERGYLIRPGDEGKQDDG